MHSKLNILCVPIPSIKSTIMTSSEQIALGIIVNTHHDIIFVLWTFYIRCFFFLNWPVKIFINSNNAWILINFLTTLIVIPTANTLVPTNCREENVLWWIYVQFIRIVDTDQWSYFTVNFRSPVRDILLIIISSLSMVSFNCFQNWTIWKIPNFNVATLWCSYKTSLNCVKTSCCDFLLLFTLICCRKLWHKLTVFNVPNVYETSIVCTDNWFKHIIVQSKSYFTLMGCVNFFLSFERPKIDFSWA